MTQLEFWPDYGPGPLWIEGKPADMVALGLSADLIRQLEDWNSRYAEDKIPIDGTGEAGWLSEGQDLLHRTRRALGATDKLVVTEPWWGADPD